MLLYRLFINYPAANTSPWLNTDAKRKGIVVGSGPAAVPNTALSSNSKGKGKKKHIGDYVL